MNNQTNQTNETNWDRPVRKDWLDELDILIMLLKAMRGDSNLVNRSQDIESQKIIERLQSAINRQLDILYPHEISQYVISEELYNQLMKGPITFSVEPTINNHTHTQGPEGHTQDLPNVTIEGAQVVQTPEGYKNDSAIDDAVGEINYHHYIQAIYYLGHIKGSRIARKKWDNFLNQEYITWSLGLLHNGGESQSGGIVKFYISVANDYYKKVEHTYTPTQEDKNATDWYIL